VIPISLPPLRDRDDDVLRIARSLLVDYAKEESKHFDGMSADCERALLAYDWPGNVRQLQNIMRNAVVFGAGPVLNADMLREPVGRAQPDTPAPSEPMMPPRVDHQSAAAPDLRRAQGASPPASSDLNALAGAITPLDKVERDAIENAVNLCGGDVRKAAVFLGVSPATIYRKQKLWREGG